MTHRFFQTSRPIYDAARAQLDLAFGYPNGQAETCLPPEPAVNSGDAVCLALPAEMTALPEVAPLLSALLAGGDVVEITEGEYRAALPQEDP